MLYLDLLGTRSLVNQGRMREVHDAYLIAVEKVSSSLKGSVRLERVWLSDTFLVWADDDSGPSFTWLELLARSLFFSLLSKRVPVRGAISCGNLYTVPEHGIHFGPGLIEAHDYGEDQDWIGLVLTPSAERRMAALGIPPDERLNYAQYSGSRHRVLKDGNRLFACILGGWIGINGRNPLEEDLEAMRDQCSSPAVAKKYERTLEFLRSNRRKLRLDAS